MAKTLLYVVLVESDEFLRQRFDLIWTKNVKFARNVFWNTVPRTQMVDELMTGKTGRLGLPDYNYCKAGHRSTLRSCVSAFLAATGRRRHTQVNFYGLRGALKFEQLLRFRSTRSSWTPAYSRPCYRRQNARVEHALLEQLTLLPNASIVLEDVDTHRSNFRRRVKTQTLCQKLKTQERKIDLWQAYEEVSSASDAVVGDI